MYMRKEQAANDKEGLYEMIIWQTIDGECFARGRP